MCLDCPECGELIEDIHDTTYSNVTTSRCRAGEHTGNIYKCESVWIDNFLSGEIEPWSYWSVYYFKYLISSIISNPNQKL